MRKTKKKMRNLRNNKVRNELTDLQLKLYLFIGNLTIFNQYFYVEDSFFI